MISGRAIGGPAAALRACHQGRYPESDAPSDPGDPPGLGPGIAARTDVSGDPTGSPYPRRPMPPAPVREDGVTEQLLDVKRVLNLISRHRRLISLFVAAALIASILLVFLSPPLFSSSSLVLLPGTTGT